MFRVAAQRVLHALEVVESKQPVHGPRQPHLVDLLACGQSKVRLHVLAIYPVEALDANVGQPHVALLGTAVRSAPGRVIAGQLE